MVLTTQKQDLSASSLMIRDIQKSYCSARSDEVRLIWNGNPAIFSKYDWATFVFNHVSLADVFDCLSLENICTKDFAALCADTFFSASGTIPEVRLIVNGIMFQVRSSEVQYHLNVSDLTELDPFAFFNHPFDYIRVELSGSGLDYFRTFGIDIDSILSTPFDLPEGGSYHSTRLDWAFDLVNYKPDFLSRCIADCRRLSHPDTYRVPVNKHSVVWSEKGGKEKTLYLGSTGSERLLRIYDKLMQYKRGDKLGDVPYKCGDILPDSWIRIELQTRNHLSSEILYNCTSPEMCMRYIYDQFAMRDLAINRPSRREAGDILPYWNDLFDFSCIPQLIHNKNFVQFRERFEVACNYIYGTAYGNLIYLIAKMGVSSFLAHLSEVLVKLQLSPHPSDQSRLKKIKSLLLSDTFDYPEFVIVDDNGIIRLDLNS